jgi:TonB family protein
MALSMVESLFWFHPLIRYGNQEIDTYREISCDQEVLSKSDFSIKSYANLLYELVPLNTGVGKLSVSMAVKNSTLKKRIKTMKYHKLHKASFRQSIFFLFLMILGITLPIACSDLRGPQTVSYEELENSKISIQDAKVTVNGVPLESKNFKDISAGGLGAISLIAGEYGIFKVAPRQFEGGVNAGKIDGNTLSFKINEISVELNSSSQILEGTSSSSLWISHNTKIVEATKKFPPMLIAHENINANFPPPPPSTPTVGEEEDLGDYFVVVEEMPKLIGGMKALQAKVEYPAMARRAGIEGRVTVQFIVNEQGNVENAVVVRGIGGGADEEALNVIKEAKFEPGLQRGRTVRVQYALSINFRLEESEFSQTPQPPVKEGQSSSPK